MKKWICVITMPLFAAMGTSLQAQQMPQQSDAVLKFGDGYVRAFVETVHLPKMSDAGSLLSIKIVPGNDQALEFPWTIEGKRGETYSAIGEQAITPFFALNNKAPLEINVSLRTHKPVSGIVGTASRLLQSLSEAAPAVAPISVLANYAKSANQLADRYSAETMEVDFNRKVLWDENNDNFIEIGNRRKIFVFTKGHGMFTAYTIKGKKFWLTEKMIEDIVPLVDAKGSRQRTPYIYKVRLPNQPELQDFLPTGKEAVLKVAFQIYRPYVNVGSTPMQRDNFSNIPIVGVHFANLAKLARKYPEMGPLEGATTEAMDLFGDSILKLTSTGDLSLTDARKLLEVFKRKVVELTKPMVGISRGNIDKAITNLNNAIPAE